MIFFFVGKNFLLNKNAPNRTGFLSDFSLTDTYIKVFIYVSDRFSKQLKKKKLQELTERWFLIILTSG